MGAVVASVETMARATGRIGTRFELAQPKSTERQNKLD